MNSEPRMVCFCSAIYVACIDVEMPMSRLAKLSLCRLAGNGTGKVVELLRNSLIVEVKVVVTKF